MVFISGRVPFSGLAGHGSVRCRTPDKYAESLEGMGEHVIDCGRLKAAVKHTIAASRVTPGSVTVPVRFIAKRPEAVGVAAFGPEIAGPLPAEDIPGRVAPGGTIIVPVACQEVDEERCLVEPPGPIPSASKDLSEEKPALFPVEEYLFLRSKGVAVSGRNRHPLDTQTHDKVEMV